MPSILRIDQVNFNWKKVLMRVDFDVPMENGRIVSNQKIVASLQSIKYVLKEHCKAVILISHIGNPDGKRNEKYSLKPIRDELQNLLKRDVTFLDDCCGEEIEMTVIEPEEESVYLLENLRFHIEETGGSVDGKIKVDPKKITEFRRSLRRLGDVYVNDDFAHCHRADSSMLGQYYDTRAAGFLFMKEIDHFYVTLQEPERPFLAILGGNRVVEKIMLMDALIGKVDEIIIGGGIVFTFLKVHENMKIGESLYDPQGAKFIPLVMEKAEKRKVAIHFPVDFVTGDKMENDASVGRGSREGGIKKGQKGLDIGPKSLKDFAKIIRRAKILIWSGPMGAYEYEPFSNGTKEMIDAIVDQTIAKGVTFVSGVETIIALEKWDALKKVSYVSTGGEATIELLKGKRMPGIDALCDEDWYCREKCNILTVIRPNYEDNPFGKIDIEGILEQRRQKKEKEAQERKQNEQKQGQLGGKDQQNQGQSNRGESKGSTSSKNLQAKGSTNPQNSTAKQGAKDSKSTYDSKADSVEEQDNGGKSQAFKSSKSLPERESTNPQNSTASQGAKGSKLSNESKAEKGSVQGQGNRGASQASKSSKSLPEKDSTNPQNSTAAQGAKGSKLSIDSKPKKDSDQAGQGSPSK